jgi:hypothetical protein
MNHSGGGLSRQRQRATCWSPWRQTSRSVPAIGLPILLVLLAPGCRPGAGVAGARPAGEGAGSPLPPPPFAPLPAHIQAAKVKQLLTGRALTADELDHVAADPATALPGLIDGWMALPEWQAQTLAFFRQAFQQTQTELADYAEQLGRPGAWNRVDAARFVRAAEESFARTALALVQEGRPFTETVTTERFQLNPPLMSAYAYMDATPFNDQNRPVLGQLWLLQKYPTFRFERTTNLDPATGAPTPIPISESLDPAGPNFMRWYDPHPYEGADIDLCREPQVATGYLGLRTLGNFLFGGRTGACGTTDSQWTVADWDSWRWVTVRPPGPGEERTIFWDLPRLRDPGTSELVLATPRVGFLTTPAFFANWPTNPSNAYRVTTNQALIVGLGRSFDDRGTAVSVNETSSDQRHLEPGTPCYGCHRTLDPMRDFFRRSYSLGYFQQLTPAGLPAEGTFTVDDSPPLSGPDIRTFARGMAEHPRFAVAWTLKLCQHANAVPCQEDDPELQRVAGVFAASGHDWKRLVRELFSSPLVTFAAPTASTRPGGGAVGILRREGLCGALEQRTGLPDPCGLAAPLPGAPPPARELQVLRLQTSSLARTIPGGGYLRGDERSVLPHDPSLFYLAATENICGQLAGRLLSGPLARPPFTGPPEQVVQGLATALLGLPPNHPRAPALTALLQEHFAEAQAGGFSAVQALESTFVLACASPPAISLGL